MRSSLLSALGMLLPVLLAGTPAVAADLAGSRPNVIVVMTDDQGYAAIGRHGHPWIDTPNLDQLHDRSVRLDRFFVSPTCAPTRSALMTGRHSMRNGVTHTILERERMALDAITLPQVLKTVGYSSGIFGKWHLGDEDDYQPGSRGFDEVFIHGGGGIGQSYPCSCADAPGNEYFNPAIRHNGKFVRTEGYCTDLFFDAAIDWITTRSHTDTPFFAYIATNAPHGPFIAPETNAKRFTDLGFSDNQAGFYGMIENIDENMGRLDEAIQRLGLTENTVMIFLSDNGITGGGSGLPAGKSMGTLPDGTEMFPYNAGMKGLKGSPDEGGVRVPFFVHWKGKLEGGLARNEVAAAIDFFPTIAELAGAAVPENQVEGRSFLPLLVAAVEGRDQVDWPDRYLFTHQGRWPTGSEPNDFQWKTFAVRNARFRFVNNNALFDMIADPGQEKNCIEEHPEVVAAMRAAYDQWWKTTRAMMVNEEAPMSPTQPFTEAYRAQEKDGGIPPWKPTNPVP